MLPDWLLLDALTTIDHLVLRCLAEAAVEAPPVDALHIAADLGMTVLEDRGQAARARLVRMNRPAGRGLRTTIVLRTEPRTERRQWAVAHEIGEHLAIDVLQSLGVEGSDVASHTREEVANLLASRLLLPTDWLQRHGASLDWDLLELKSIYSTASCELLARRMLDFDASLVVTVFDQQALHWRRASGTRPAPRLTSVEQRCWSRVHKLACPQRTEGDGFVVRGWPIHEPAWKREILRTEISEDWQGDSCRDEIEWSEPA